MSVRDSGGGTGINLRPFCNRLNCRGWGVRLTMDLRCAVWWSFTIKCLLRRFRVCLSRLLSRVLGGVDKRMLLFVGLGIGEM